MTGMLKYACWLPGGVGLLAAYVIFSTPMHVPVWFTLALAGSSVCLLFLGLIVYVSQGRHRR